VREADGDDGDPDNIENRDNLESASVVMLSPSNPRGTRLKKRVEKYRDYIGVLIPDTAKRNNITEALSTEDIRQQETLAPRKWEEAKFDQQPVVAAITLLSKLQNDILYAEGEALSSLLSQVDAGDLRVNEIFIKGVKLDNDKGLYEVNTGSTGNFDYTGWLQVTHGDGTVTRHDFASSYTVIEPTATVSATMMNVLYAGIDNPVSISVPGIATADISATMTNGTLSRQGDKWVARPGAVGQDAVVTVTARMDGRPVNVANTTFRVRRLPDPTPFISYSNKSGATEHYRGGKPFLKAMLLASPGLEAAIDDGLLDTPFTVESFETVFFDSSGNAMPEVSAGSKL